MWGRRPKASREGTRGGWVMKCLWGFDGGAAWVREVLVGLVGIGSSIDGDGASTLPGVIGRSWHDYRHWIEAWRRRSAADAAPDTRSCGEWAVREG